MGWRGQVTTTCLAAVALLAGCTRQGPPTAAPDTTATAPQRQVPSPRAAAFQPVGERIGLFFGQVRPHMRADDRPRVESYIRSALLSPLGKRLAYVAKVGDSEALVLDGKLTGTYHSVERLLFSPDGQHFAYLAERPSGKLLVVHDDNAGRKFGWIAGESLTFSPDSQHLAYYASEGELELHIEAGRFFTGKCYVVLDGHLSRGYEDVRWLTFSPDSRRLAFCANKGQRSARSGDRSHGTWHVVVDGKQGPGYNYVHRPVFSGDGSRSAYRALKDAKGFGEMGWEGGRRVIVIDGKESSARHEVQPETILFSADGRRLAYVAFPSRKQRVVVVDGRKSRLYRWVYNLTFSPDGERLAYIASDHPPGPGAFVVVDGKEGRSWHTLMELQFGPNGELAYLAGDDRDQWRAVIDGKEGPTYDEVRRIKFSPNGKRVVYRARKGEKWVAVVDGNEGPEYDFVGGVGARALPSEMVFYFSPNGERLAYWVQKGKKWVLVADGEEGPEHDSPGEHSRHAHPVFSHDGEHLAYRARSGEGWVVVADEEERGPYDFVSHTALRIDGEGVLHYLAEKSGSLWWESQPLEPTDGKPADSRLGQRSE